MKKYLCHKTVEAEKIAAITSKEEGGAVLVGRTEDGSYFTIATVDQAYLDKHDPQPGGYFVVYENGYQSWSPADVFEAGYVEVENVEVEEVADDDD